LQEKKINLDDDFIKFLRFVHNVLDETSTGILGFITNNTYLDGITHRQMRRAILDSNIIVQVIDLHGSSIKKERAPDGSKDENVFDIQQGVGISLWSKISKNSDKDEVFSTSIWGNRDTKYKWLLNNTANLDNFEELSPTSPYWFFVPKNFDLKSEYDCFVSLLDAFETNGNSIKTDRDSLFFSNNRNDLIKKMKLFYSPDGVKEPFRSSFNVENSSSYPLLERRKNTKYDENLAQKCLYRPFDFKWLYYGVGITSRPAWNVMKHMKSSGSIGLLAMRQYDYAVPNCSYFLATSFLTECRIFVSNRGIANCFPLYLLNNESGSQQMIKGLSHPKVNFRMGFLEKIAGILMHQSFNEYELFKIVSPEEIFGYIYSLFHSLNYRKRYAAFLKIEYPRIPIVKNLDLFRLLIKFGQNLVSLHIMQSKNLEKTITTFNGTSGNRIEKVAYSRETVWLNRAETIGFRGVSENVWKFNIGGYQICEKWLKDRQAKGGRNPHPGLILTDEDIDHYQKIIVAISETIRIMGEIDEVIEVHGGWPDAFVTE
jgi:predicted helicase